MMSAKQDTKVKKPKKGKSAKQPESPKQFRSPEKAQVDKLKTPYLRELSPYSPLYRTIKKPYNNSMNCDLAIIETPLNAHNKPKSIIEEVQGTINQISKLLVWEEEEDRHVNSPSGGPSYSSQGGSSEVNRQQEIGAEQGAKKTQDIKDHHQSQIIQKAGQKIKTLKSDKKPKQKTLRLQQPQTKKKVSCNCKKTKCLKLYCDCFHANQVCGPECNCFGCHNTDQHQEERYNSMLSLMERNPEAFRPKLEAEQHAKGCNCRKSGCLKKYCECYQAGLPCGEHCKCQECKNCKQGEGYRGMDRKQLEMKAQVRSGQ